MTEQHSTNDNHAILLKLQEGQAAMASNVLLLTSNVSTVTTTLDNFMRVQTAENANLRASDENTRKDIVASEKMAADRSRVTPTLIVGVLTCFSLVGGFGLFFVNLRTDPMRNDIAIAEQQRLSMDRDLVKLQIESSSNDASAARDRHWIEKLQDELRAKLATP